jgi:uncharacterized protein (TIGR02099 family)
MAQWLGLAAGLLVIGMVILVFLGRQTIGQLDELRPSVKSFIASSTGFHVNMGALKGEWPQLIPIINVEGVELINSEQETVLSFEGARADLDLYSSLKLGSPIWRELAIDKLDINFVENALGHWRLKGFNGETDTDLNIILEPFLYSQHIRLKAVTVHLHSFSGQKIQLFGNDMSIENDKDFHRAQLSVSLTENGSPANLIIEALGHLTDLNQFKASGYLDFDELNIYQSLKMLSASLMPDIAIQPDQYSINAGGRVWLDFKPGWHLDYQGELSISKIPLNWLDDNVSPITNIKTMLTGWYLPGEDWGARLNDLEFDLGSTNMQSVNLLYKQKLGSNWQEFDVLLEDMGLESVAGLISETQLVSADAINHLKSDKSKGNISSLSMGRSSAGFYLAANLEEFFMPPYAGMPGFKELDGYLEIKQSKGLFHIADYDGFELFFPKNYTDYTVINEALGTIYFDWQSPEQTTIFSDSIYTKLEAGDSQLKFSMIRPKGGQKAADYNLLIGAKNLNLALTNKYLPYTMSERSSDWVKNSIKDGNLKQFGLLFRSGPPKNDHLSRTMQLLFDTQDATIKFNPNWPQFTALEGLFVVDSGNLSAQIKSALLDQAAVSQTRIEFSVKSPIAQRKWVIDGQLDADLSSMIDLLIQSPLKKNLGPMVNWSYTGQTNTQLHMKLPAYMANKAKPAATEYKVTSLINNGDMSITGSPIKLEKLMGEIEFSSDKGITSDNLSAELWNQPLTARLYRDDQQKMSFSSALAPRSLTKFVDFPWQNIISETILINGTLYKDPANRSKTTLEIQSDMEAVAVNLPAPVGKSINQSKPLSIKLHFEPSLSQIEGKLGQYLVSDMRFDQGKLKRGVISYDQDLVMPDQDMLLISANLPTIDFRLWQPLRDLVDQKPKAANTLETIFDLELAQWEVSGLQLSNISATITPMIYGFDAVFTSDLADGSVSLFRDTRQPPKIALNRLSLSNNFAGNSASLDPRVLVATDFSVDRLTIADQDLGTLSFELRPEPSGASFNNISGNIFGLSPGIYSSEAPTEFFWGYDGQAHISKLVGPIGINNIGDLFNVFSLPQVLDSQSGRFDANLTWRGEPWAINKDNLNGQLKINLVDGNFYRTAGGAGTALKLVGLFNFANWLKRLQLDFSDVVGQNLVYNRLDGTLSFDQSVLSLDDALKIKMPSGRMSMAGDFDLGLETVDAQLVATLPVVTNLPWLAGLAGGLPAALGVYATSKLVENQVDRLSSISYEISGRWDDVDVAVDKIFAAELSEPSQ